MKSLLNRLWGRYAPGIVFILFSILTLASVDDAPLAYFLGVLAGGAAGFLIGHIYGEEAGVRLQADRQAKRRRAAEEELAFANQYEQEERAADVAFLTGQWIELSSYLEDELENPDSETDLLEMRRDVYEWLMNEDPDDDAGLRSVVDGWFREHEDT